MWAEKGAASVRRCSQDSVMCVPPRPFGGVLKHSRGLTVSSPTRPFGGVLKHSRGLTVSSPTDYRSPYVHTRSPREPIHKSALFMSPTEFIYVPSLTDNVRHVS